MRLHRYKRVAFADELEEKLDAKPDGTNNLIVNNKINTAYLPDTLLGALHFVGAWDASSSSGTPSYTPAKGDYWICNGAGTHLPTGATFEDGFQVGDWAVYTGNALISWIKVDNTDAVTMVNDQIGSVRTYKGTWTVSTTYYAGDFVKDSNNVVYLCIQTGTNIALTNTAYWHSFDVPIGAYKITAVTETADSINVTLEAV